MKYILKKIEGDEYLCPWTVHCIKSRMFKGQSYFIFLMVFRQTEEEFEDTKGMSQNS